MRPGPPATSSSGWAHTSLLRPSLQGPSLQGPSLQGPRAPLYQHRAAGYWPIWGSDDLKFGFGGALGTNGFCNRLHEPGYTYEGLGQEVCGGNHHNWGPMEMEVWALAV